MAANHPKILAVVGEQHGANPSGRKGDKNVVQQRRQLRPPALVPLFNTGNDAGRLNPVIECGADDPSRSF
jgi:hypothetical protein